MSEIRQWHMAGQGRTLPHYVQAEFESYLKCGQLEHGFLRVRCNTCHAEQLVAFSCKRRGICPSCGARRMAETAALLVADVLPLVMGPFDHLAHCRRAAIRAKVLSLPAGDPAQASRAGKVGGFGLRADVAVRANQPNKRERLCRYIARPALWEQRLSLTAGGRVRYELKTPWRNGATHLVFEPLEFLAKLAALVPRPRVHLTRCHGVFAPNSVRRSLVTKAGQGRAHSAKAAARTPAERRSAMTWAQRFARVFDIRTCTACVGTLCIIASIEDPVTIKAILAHLAIKARAVHAPCSPPGRAPPAPVFS